MLATLFTYLLNNYLSVGREMPSAAQLFSGNFSVGALIQLAIYAAGIGVAAWFVYNNQQRTLRADAAAITRFNTYLIRGCFWAVLFVGIADMSISFLRVEGILGNYVSEEMVKQLGRSAYRGLYIHYPLIAAGFFLALFTRTLGFQWLALLIVAVRFWYAALFLFASAYTLLHEGHVRVDVFYAGLSRRAKGRVNAVGAILFGMALCWTILLIGLQGKASVIYGPLASFEVSQSGFGMYTKYLMAGYLGIFAISMLIQFVSQLFEARADVREDPGAREPAPEDFVTN